MPIKKKNSFAGFRNGENGVCVCVAWEMVGGLLTSNQRATRGSGMGGRSEFPPFLWSVDPSVDELMWDFVSIQFQHSL